jgi:hypothetical protein
MPGISKRSRGWRGHEPFPDNFGQKSAVGKAAAKARLRRRRAEAEKAKAEFAARYPESRIGKKWAKRKVSCETT